MIIEMPITALKVGIFPISTREKAAQDFFSNSYSPTNYNQNLSHSGDWLALGQHASSYIGIDLEIAPAPNKYISVANEFFWPEESEFLLKISEKDKQAECFLALWTAKEACCKLFRSNIYDSLPGINFIAWLTRGLQIQYQFTYFGKEIILLFKTGRIGGNKYFLSVAI